MGADWDNLIVLDACRYDTFAERHTLSGRLERRRARGSATREFVRNNFVGHRFPDTVCVTANPFVTELAGDAFHHCAHTWRTRWDDDLGTTPPEPMARAVRDVAERYPRKRLIAHFMQPHHPFIGETAEEHLGDVAGNERARRRAGADGETDRLEEPDHVWARLAAGELSLSVVRRAYEETLDAVMPHVAELVEMLPGRTVVTSDHGNLLDEAPYRFLSVGGDRFGHPIHATAPSLVRVPWLVVPGDERKEIVAGTRREPDPGDREEGRTEETEPGATVADRLESLGYR